MSTSTNKSAAEPTPPSSTPGKYQRKTKNFLLEPGMQSALGFYCILLSCFFAISVGIIFYFNFSDLIDSILLLTDAQEEVQELMTVYWNGFQMYLYGAFIVYMIATITVAIWYTHRLVGPTIAFRRHIQALIDRDYAARTNLRKKDAFVEVADKLNELSEVLGKDFETPGRRKDGVS